MSDLQQINKKVIVSLINAEKFTLTKAAQKDLAAWSAMTIMVAEFFEPKHVAVQYKDRKYLKVNKTPPENWKIWIAPYNRKDFKADWIHRSFRISNIDIDIPHSEDPSIPLPNAQFSTIIVGKLYIHAFSCELDSVVKNFNFESWVDGLIVPIWPEQKTDIFWPVISLSDEQAIHISEYGMQAFHRIGKMFGDF